MITIDIMESEIGQMKCRQIAIDDISQDRIEGTPLFTQYTLEYPDFIEFDDLNGVIVTSHHAESVYRVWSMTTLSLMYVMSNPDITEFKIW